MPQTIENMFMCSTMPDGEPMDPTSLTNAPHRGCSGLLRMSMPVHAVIAAADSPGNA